MEFFWGTSILSTFVNILYMFGMNMNLVSVEYKDEFMSIHVYT